MARNSNLSKAKSAKNDEFYTQMSDIEKELRHYKEHFKNKIVFCNCDDPEWSNFWRYFELNFDHLGLKKLISTHFDREKPSYKLELYRDNDGSVKTLKTPLKQNGDFRSEECVEMLKECDVVVTNPPFSLFREYVGLLMEYGKKFVILGNMNAITYKEIFPLIKDNKIWIGYNNGSHNFYVPDDYEDKKYYIDENGRKYVKMGNICWYTNLDIKKRHEPLILYREYHGHEDEYPHYDNYDAINVDKTKDIPMDYVESWGVTNEEYKLLNEKEWVITRKEIKDEKELLFIIPSLNNIFYHKYHEHTNGYKEEIENILTDSIFCSGEIGVPISFLNKHNPEQFEIVKFRKGNDGKDLTYTLSSDTIRQTDSMSILQNCGQTDTVMESLESQYHLLTNTVSNNSTSLEMNIASIYRKEDVISKRKEFIAEFSLRRYCSGVMGVPISFLDKFCPEQFKIITMSTMSGRTANYWSLVKGKSKYSRIFIKLRWFND